VDVGAADDAVQCRLLSAVDGANTFKTVLLEPPAGLPDLRVKPQDQIAERGKLVGYEIFRGTGLRPFCGVAPACKPLNVK